MFQNVTILKIYHPLKWYYKMKRNNKIPATFWGEFVDQILIHLDESIEKPVIIVMQLIKAHKFKEEYSVRNTWHASKLWINPDLPQVVDFRSRKEAFGLLQL